MAEKETVMLIIMDGFGCSDIKEYNAVAQADLKVLPELWRTYPHSYLEASAEAVGLPHGQIGNSEVGHLNIGAGRIVYQSLTRITKDIEAGEFFAKPVLKDAMHNACKSGRSLHIMGLVSPGGVHSSEKHLYGLLEMAKRNGVEHVYMCCRAVPVPICGSWRKYADASVSVKLPRSAADIMPWIAISDGNV